MPFPSHHRGRSAWMILAATWILAFVIGDSRTRPLIGNTIAFAGGSGLISLVFGTLLAIYIQRTNLWGRRIIAATTVAMLFLPGYLQVASWQAGLGMQGWLCRWLFPDQPLAVLVGWRGALWTQVILNVPWVVLIVRLGLATMPAEIEVQSSLDASGTRVLTQVTLPALRSSLLAAWLWVFCLAAGDITVTDVYQIRTFAEEMYTGFALGDDLSAAQRRNVPGALLVTGTAVAALLTCREMTERLRTRTLAAPWRMTIVRPSTRLSLSVLGVGLMLAWLGIPLASLLIQAGRQVVVEGDQRVRIWSAEQTLTILSGTFDRFGQEFAWSFALAQMTAIPVTVLAVSLAWCSRGARLTMTLAWGLALLGLAIPGPLVALGILGIFDLAPVSSWLAYLADRTLLIPCLSLSIRVFPPALLIAHWATRRVNTQLLDIATVHGANRWHRLRWVVLPQLATSLVWIWVLLVAICVADLSSTVLAVPPGVTTLAIRIFNLAHYGVDDQLAGLCLVATALFASLAWLVVGLTPRQST